MKKLRLAGCWVLALIFQLTNTQLTQATHIRAGEIIAERISSASLTYKFTIVGYSDTGSSVIFGGGEINFGDGTVLILAEHADNDGTHPLEDEVAYNWFEITHTFSAPGQYTISYNERNRNAGVQNMSNSVDTPFYTETVLEIDPFVGENSTPIFLVPPIDKGAVGVAFFHNPGAYDSEGDSLSYELSVPKQSSDQEVTNYLSPVNAGFYENYSRGNEDQDAKPTFEIDPVTGNLTWDAPGYPGEFNIALVVKEWRKVEGNWFLLSSMTRDMQVILEDSDNRRPEITTPENVCAEVGSDISMTITASDPDDHQLKVEAFGGPFEQEIHSATLSPSPAEFQDSPASVTFNWETGEDNLRTNPYYLVLKATDNPELGPKLVDFNFFTVQLASSSPENLTLGELSSNNEMPMSWTPYDSEKLTQMAIWRRVGSEDFDNSSCDGLDLIAHGYNQILEVSSSAEAIDAEVSAAAKYCYRIQSTSEEQYDGRSRPSEEACFIANANAAIPVKVDVSNTNEVKGEIELKWLKPFDLDEEEFPGPYTYQIFRGESSEDMSLIDTTDEQEYTDTGVNSTVQLFYRIDTYDHTSNLINRSTVASTIELTTKTTGPSIQLNWTAKSPWSIVDTKHKIFRDNVEASNPSKFVRIATVDAAEDGMRYSDGDVIPDKEYRYLIKIDGDYHNPQIDDKIINSSQIVSGHAVINAHVPVTKDEILVYPNPFVDLINIRHKKIGEKVSVLSSGGQLILQSIQTDKLNLHGLESGIYFLRFSSGKVVRLVKK